MAFGSSSSTNLKIATLCLGLVFILHTVGFALPRWSSFTLSAAISEVVVDVNYHIGLWKDCTCSSFLGTETCSCYSKLFIPDWMKGVRALETLALIGLLISLIISIVMVCRRQDKTIRGFNILCGTVSGMFIVTGAILFGVENAEDFEKMFNLNDSLLDGFDKHGTLASGFFLCTVAGCLCLVCVLFLVNDYRQAFPLASQQANQMPVLYSTQGHHVIIPTQGQTHVAVKTYGQHQTGHMPAQAQSYPIHMHPGYGQSGQILQGQPAYAPYYPPNNSHPTQQNIAMTNKY